MKDAILNFVRMRTRSLVPRPNTMLIVLLKVNPQITFLCLLRLSMNQLICFPACRLETRRMRLKTARVVVKNKVFPSTVSTQSSENLFPSVKLTMRNCAP